MQRRTCLTIGVWFLAALGALTLAFCVLSSLVVYRQKAVAQAGVTASYDVVYRQAGEAELKLDLVRPARGIGPFPAVFLIHGGAWRAGNKNQMRAGLTQLASRGYVAVAPQYRFCPRETFPAQVHDVKAAVRWLKEHAREYRVDTGRIGAVGYSAGGHLALMLGTTGPDDGLEGEAAAGAPDSRIHAVVNFFGPTDLTADDLPEATRPLVRDFLGGSPEDRPEVAARASPLTFVTKDDAPTLTIQGTRDPLVPHTQATKLADAMTAAGVPGRVELLLGAGHGFAGEDFSRTLEETYAFLDRYVKRAGR